MRIEETDRGSNSVWPAVPISTYRDGFGNRCNRVLAPAGRLRLMTDCVSGGWDGAVTAKKAFVKKTAVKKTVTKKASPVKKAAAKKAAAKKTAPAPAVA